MDILLHRIWWIIEIVFGFGVVIFMHELGHLLFAKWQGIRVVTFSIGMPPTLRKLFRKGDTDYVLSWIPVGGYTEMAGGETLTAGKEPQPGDFLFAPWWRRIIATAAGPLMNFVLAYLLIFFLLVTGMNVASFPAKIGESAQGLRAGDEILAVNGRDIVHWGDIGEAVREMTGDRPEPVPPPLTVKVKRGDRVFEQRVQPRFDTEGKYWKLGLVPHIQRTTEISKVMVGMPAEVAGIKAGDRIAEIDGRKIMRWEQVSDRIHQAMGAEVKMVIVRNGQRHALTVRTMVQELPGVGRVGLIGIEPRILNQITVRKHLSPDRAATAAAVSMRDFTVTLVNGLWQLVSGKVSVSQSLGGPISIARMMGRSASEGWRELVNLCALISIMLGIMNLLPIPMVDGGHIVLFLIEGLRGGKPLSPRFQDLYGKAGFILIVTLMVLATYNDIFKLIKTSFFPQIQ